MKKAIGALLLLISLTGCAQNTKTEKDVMNVNTFINDFTGFTMDIEAAGIASIPKASLSPTNDLYIEYRYTSGDENRNGKMTLVPIKEGRFEGHWKTDADNGNSYSGPLYFVFKENGEAEGVYKYAGGDYRITIDKVN